MKTKGIVKNSKRQTIYLRVIQGEDYIVAGSLKPVVWADEFEPMEGDLESYKTLVTEVPLALAKKLETMGTDEQVFSDGYEAYDKVAKYIDLPITFKKFA